MKKLKTYFSGPAPLHYLLPVLMIYLIAGTVAQKYVGLYEATRVFFSNLVIWLGPIPLPGLPILLSVVFANLACKLIFKSPWSPARAGTILAHIGVLLLLLGGLFTAISSEEGYVDLSQGQSKSFVSDYHARELAFIDENGATLAAFPQKDLRRGEILPIQGTKLSAKIVESCRNCAIQKRAQGGAAFKGMARAMEIKPDALKYDDEENLAGVSLSLRGSQDDGTYIALEGVPENPEIHIDDKPYRFLLRRAQRDLPFAIELIDFARDMHPGTNMAKSYRSHVRIIDGPARWESEISMNKPLRYKGYAIFQSSFITAPEGDVSVLAVVKNAGRAFPYISAIAICLGVALHLFTRRRKTP